MLLLYIYILFNFKISCNPDKEDDSMRYRPEEQPGVAGDLSQTVQGSRYPETEPVDYSIHEEGKKKQKHSNLSIKQ